VTALFNYYNRIADGLGIEAEPEWAGGEGSSVASTGSPRRSAGSRASRVSAARDREVAGGILVPGPR
jgi:hypothetical protein